MGVPSIHGNSQSNPASLATLTDSHGPSGRPLLSVVLSGVLTSARIGYAGNGPRSVQVSQISWPRCRLLGVAVHVCPGRADQCYWRRGGAVGGAWDR